MGVVAYFLKINFWLWFLLNILYEISENTPAGMDFINRYVGGLWPGGGKAYPDSYLNSVGDIGFALLGWGIAKALDEYGLKKEWYVPNKENV